MNVAAEILPVQLTTGKKEWWEEVGRSRAKQQSKLVPDDFQIRRLGKHPYHGQVDEGRVKIHRVTIGEAISPVGTQQRWSGGEAEKALLGCTAKAGRTFSSGTCECLNRTAVVWVGGESQRHPQA